MPNRWIEFVRKNSHEKNISWNCAICEIKEKGLYKPINKQQQKEEEEQRKEELLADQILRRSIKSFVKRFTEIRNHNDFYDLKNSFFNRSKAFTDKVQKISPNFYRRISGEYGDEKSQSDFRNRQRRFDGCWFKSRTNKRFFKSVL